MEISFTLDFQQQSIETDDPLLPLLDVLRDLGAKAVKPGCREGECGACSVLVDGLLTKSCIYPVYKAMGKHVITAAGVLRPASGNTREIKQAELIDSFLIQDDVFQCGYCQSGFIVATKALLDESRSVSKDDVAICLNGNLCRCTGYLSIIEAVLKTNQEFYRWEQRRGCETK